MLSTRKCMNIFDRAAFISKIMTISWHQLIFGSFQFYDNDKKAHLCEEEFFGILSTLEVSSILSFLKLAQCD